MSTITVNFRLRLAWVAKMAWLLLLAAAASEPEESAAYRLPSAACGYSPLLGAVLNPPRAFAERAGRFCDLLYRGGATAADIREEKIRGSSQGGRNIHVAIPGREARAGILLFGAHLDAHPGSAGAIDNWSGAVMLASLYAYCRLRVFRHTLVFVGFGDEEIGLAGAEDFFDRRQREGGALRAMINLECLGAGPPVLWANRSSDRLENIFMRAARAAQTPLRRQILFGYQTDSFVFARAGIPTLTIHSLSPPLLSLINSPYDTPELLRMRWYRAAFRLLTEAVHLLDQEDGEFPTDDSEGKLRPLRAALVEGVRAESGILRIHDLPRDSAEWRSGLRPGDILLAISDTTVRHTGDLMGILLTSWRGCRMPLLVMRQQQTFVVEVSY